MGGQMQPQGHLQLVSNLIDFNMDVQSALDAPRFRVMDDGNISLERGIPDGISNRLREKKHRIVPPNTFFPWMRPAAIITSKTPENERIIYIKNRH